MPAPNHYVMDRNATCLTQVAAQIQQTCAVTIHVVFKSPVKGLHHPLCINCS